MPSRNAVPTRLLLLICAPLVAPAAAQDLSGIAAAADTTRGPAPGAARDAAPPASPAAARRARPRPRAAGPGTRRAGRPRSATVVTRRQLSERNVQTLAEAVAYTPEGSVDAAGYDPRGDGIDIRGFDTTYNAIFRDGLIQSAANLAIPRVEPYGVEAVSVLRGPAAGVYGFNTPAGILGVATKQPKFEPFGEVQLQVGNYDRYQGNFDVGGPVEGSDGTMAYRLTGLVRQADTFLPGGPDDRTSIAPAFTWKPDADTTLTVLSEYLHLRLPSNPSYFYYRGYDVSRIYQGDPAFGTLRQEQYRVGYAFEHKLSPDLTVRQNARYAGLSNDFPAVYTYAADDGGLRRTAERAPRNAVDYRSNLASFALDTQVEARAETGPVGHTLTVGLDYRHIAFKSRFGQDSFGGTPALDLRMPTYGLRLIRQPSLEVRGLQAFDQAGLYVQEQAKWDRFILTLAGQHTWLSSQTARIDDVNAGRPSETLLPQYQNRTAFTYRVGLNYGLTPDIVPYASYATTFTPQPGFLGRIQIPPTTGDQLDLGVKFAVPEANVTGSVNGFNVNQSFKADTDLTQVFFQFAPGNVVSRGVEMEMTAAVSPGTTLTFAYRHLDLRYTNQDVILPGQRIDLAGATATVDGNVVSGIPGDTVTAFGTYLFPTASPLSGLTLGGGVRFLGPSAADDRNLVRNPTATLFDAVAAFDLAALDPKYKGLRAQINGTNIFNRTYTVCQTVFCYRGAPATVIGSLVYRW